jgi:hypothetical protein
MSYKVWQENNRVPCFVLEITSLTTQENDEKEKPRKYAEIGVKEYFQYDPTGDYLRESLKGAKLVSGIYQPLPKQVLADGTISIYSEVLGLDLRITGGQLRFYESKSDRKLLSHRETELARQQAELEKQRVQHSLFLAIARLNAMGLTPEAIADALNLPLTEVKKILAQ